MRVLHLNFSGPHKGLCEATYRCAENAAAEPRQATRKTKVAMACGPHAW